jgi:hypothetical protein
MFKVWVMKNNGSTYCEEFGKSDEAVSYARGSSVRAACSFVQVYDEVMVYEYGELTQGERKADIIQYAIEAISREEEYDVKSARSRPIGKKGT